MNQDMINGGFELLGAFFAWANARRLYRDRELRGVYWPAWAFFTVWGLWNLFYYPSLAQWFSFSAGIALATGNLAWTVMAVWLWLANRRARVACLADLESTLAKSHRWDADGERCLNCGDKDWFADPVCGGARMRSMTGSRAVDMAFELDVEAFMRD